MTEFNELEAQLECAKIQKAALEESLNGCAKKVAQLARECAELRKLVLDSWIEAASHRTHSMEDIIKMWRTSDACRRVESKTALFEGRGAAGVPEIIEIFGGAE